MRFQQILLDMDGVLVDLVGGLCRAHGKPWPYRNGFVDWHFSKAWGLTDEELYRVCDEEFWANLEPTAEMPEVFRLAAEAVGVLNVSILSAPGHHPGSVPGKVRWLKKHGIKLPAEFRGDKHVRAHPTRLLVDDSPKQVPAFRAAGGQAILFPRPWNGNAGKEPIPYLREELRKVR